MMTKALNCECALRTWDISDLEKVIALQRKTIIYTPLNGANQPLMLSNLGNSYLCRYERFGVVKDMNSTIRQQLKAFASILCDTGSTLRPAILPSLEMAYAHRFEWFGERKDIDFAIN